MYVVTFLLTKRKEKKIKRLIIPLQRTLLASVEPAANLCVHESASLSQPAIALELAPIG